jgi:hypothetical protein
MDTESFLISLPKIPNPNAFFQGCIAAFRQVHCEQKFTYSKAQKH